MTQNDYLVAFKQDTRVGPFYSKHRWVKGVDKNDAIANYKTEVFIDPCIYGEYEVLQVGLIKKEDVHVEEVTMKERTVKENRPKEKKPLDVIEYVSQFNIASDITLCMPYILEITTDNNLERRVIIITDMGTDHIDYKYWTEDEDGVRCPKCATLLPHFFQEGICKLYKITGEDLK